jgi:hypothetical protein
MLTARQQTKRQHWQSRKQRVLQRIKDDALRAVESGTPVMYWDDDRGVYRSPDIAGCYATDRCGDVKAINLKMDTPHVQAFRLLSDNQAIDAMLRWRDQLERDSELPF